MGSGLYKFYYSQIGHNYKEGYLEERERFNRLEKQ